jgi:hypothetical protein
MPPFWRSSWAWALPKQVSYQQPILVFAILQVNTRAFCSALCTSAVWAMSPVDLCQFNQAIPARNGV